MVERALSVLALLVIVVGSVMLFAGARVVGISTDEHIQMADLGELRWAANPDQPRHFGVYGLSFQLLGHWVAVLFGVETWGEVAYGLASFEIRHLVVANLMLLMSFAVGTICWFLTQKKVWALWGAATALAIPPLVGHSFFNTKDIPVAAGYTLVTLACVATIWLLVNPMLNRRPRKFIFFAIFLATTFGIWISAGTRYLILAPELISVFVTNFLSVALVKVSAQRFSAVFASVRPLLLSTLTGVVLVALTNPCLIAPVSNSCKSGIELLPRILSASRDYVISYQTLALGQIVGSTDPPFWFLPVSLVAGLPILIMFFAVIGAVFFWENWTARPGVKGNQVSPKIYRLGLMFMGLICIFQVLTGPLAAILLRASIYDLQRQHLYVYPALAVLSVCGCALLLQKATTLKSSKKRNVLSLRLGFALLLALLLPLVDSLRLFPYTYAYVNSVASIDGYAAKWETDYWQTGLREAFDKIPPGAEYGAVGAYWTIGSFARARALPNTEGLRANREVFVVSPHRPSVGWTGPPPACDLAGTVLRNLRGHEVPMAYVSKCSERDIDEGRVSGFVTSEEIRGHF